MVGNRLLRGDRVRLTSFEDQDLELFAAWQEDTLYLRLLDADPAFPRSRIQLTEWLQSQRKSSNSYLFGIRMLDNPRLIGHVELSSILWNQGTAWLGMAIGDAAFRGKGLGTEALRLVLDFAFFELNLHRIQLTVFSYNEHAIHVYERVGFRREGAFREFLRRDGRRYDMLLYGLLRSEWEAGTREEEHPLDPSHSG